MTSELNDAQLRRDIDPADDCHVVGVKQTSPTGDDQLEPLPGGAVNGTRADDAGGPTTQNGWAEDRGAAEDDGGVGEGGAAPGTDEEGYRVEHRFETESVSRCKEVRELDDGDATELRMRETKEVGPAVEHSDNSISYST